MIPELLVSAAIMGTVAGLLVIGSNLVDERTTRVLEGIEPVGPSEFKLTIKTQTIRFGKVIAERRDVYRGSSTVFYDTGNGMRADGMLEHYMSCKLRKYMWEQEEKSDDKPAA